jgi:hypothetical protein
VPFWLDESDDCKCFVHVVWKFARLSSSDCKILWKALCCNLARGRRISRSARRYPFLCGARFHGSAHVED